MFVIMKTEYDSYVAPEYVAMPGVRSYTRDLRKARCWRNREDAEREKCGNETVVTLESQLLGGQS